MSDEPIFEAEESGLWAARKGSAMPRDYRYVGSAPEESIPEEMPTIYLDREVAAKLQSEGQRSIRIDKEVAGILLGTRSEDSQSIRVSHIAIARDEDSSPVHFKFTYSVWDDLIDQMESLSRDAGRELLLVGWYHTHPNMSVFLSRYDLRTHRDFHRPYQFALVLAPQRGTEKTSVGFFCNRGEGTPLLPGLRLFGGAADYQPPWFFETEANEDFEEGEGGGNEEADESTETHQLGDVGRERPNWLTLGEDPVEGPVLPILEGMAALVTAGHHDRIGVLLGTKTPSEHITITRVRFLGRTSSDLQLERGELLGALRFMADAFPAEGEPKILGIVRIVAPRRLLVGSVFDPVEHNLGIAELLGDVGYDVGAVPFQVGLVLLPGLRDDSILFQVFAQRRGTNSVHMNAFRAAAPSSSSPASYYRPVGSPTLTVEQPPSLRLPPGLGSTSTRDPENLADTLRESVPTVQSRPDAETDRLLQPSPILAEAAEGEPTENTEGSADGIDWDRMAREEVSDRPVFGPLLALGLFALVLVGGGALILELAATGGEQVVAEVEPQRKSSGGPSDPASVGAVDSSDAPYKVALLGCGGSLCAPFPEGAPHVSSVDLVRVERLPAYLEQSLKPIEVWVERVGGQGPRVRLERRAEGQNTRVYTVKRKGRDWGAFWGDGGSFEARLFVVPEGVPLRGEAPLATLRSEQRLRLKGPPVEVVEDPDSLQEPPAEAPTPMVVSVEGWNWRGGGSTEKVVYDSAKQAFNGRLVATGGDSAGVWVLSYTSTASGGLNARREVRDPALSRGSVDLTREMTQLMREPAVLNDLRGQSKGGAMVYASIQPPGGGAVLKLRIKLSGEAAATKASHKVCVMMAGPSGESVPGRSRVGGGSVMRPTFDASGRGECADGGASSRWVTASFGPGRTLMQFIYEGDDPALAPARGVVQKYRLPERWSTSAEKCLSITVHIGDKGWREKAPTIKPQYELLGGRCQ